MVNLVFGVSEKRFVSLALVASIAAMSGVAAAAADPKGESFVEQFDAFDPARWYVSDGWSNGDWQNCIWSKRAIRVEDGHLDLQLAPTGQAEPAQICGEVQTKARFGYGTFEARMRSDAWSGANAAFFTYIGPVHDQPHDEIDVEILTKDTDRVTFNTYVDGEARNGGASDLDVPTDEAFHTYSFIWEPTRLRWFVDGELRHEVEGEGLPVTPQKIYLSHWSTGTLTDWLGEFKTPDQPKSLKVDWVSYTAPGEGCQFDGSVLCVLDEDR